MNDAWMLLFQETADPGKGDQALTGLVHIIGITVVSLGSMATLTGLLTLVTAMAPNITYRAAYCLRTKTLFSFLVGVAALVVLLLGGAVTHQVPALSVVVLAISTLASVLAMGTTSEVLGRKLAVLSGREGSRISHLFWGWLTYAFASGVPVIGWFVIFPYGLISGLGAVVLGFFVREEV
jgi:hypothetical protein